MSNDITKVLEAEVKRIASEIQALEAKIATLKGQQSVLNNTVDFYRGGAKKSAEPAKAAAAKRGPKAAATGKRGRPKKEAKAAAPAAPAAPVAPAPVAAAPAPEKKKPGRKPAAKPAVPAAVAAPAPVAPKPVKEAKAPKAVKAAADSKKTGPKKAEVSAKPAAKPVEKPAEKPAVKEAPKAPAAKAPKATKAPKAVAEKPAAKSKGGIAERTAPKVETPAAKPAAKPAEKAAKATAKPTVSKKADKAPRGPKPGVSKAERGESLTSKVLELFKAKGELEPIDVAKGTGVGQDKFNSVRSTINILYLKGTLARRKKDGKTNTYSYAFPEHYAKAGIQYEMGNKEGK